MDAREFADLIRLIEAPHGLVLAPLAADRFCSGHLVWVQQAAKPLVKPRRTPTRDPLRPPLR